MMTFNEFEQLDEAGVRAVIGRGLQSIAEGDAPTIGLRTMALRALKGEKVHWIDLDYTVPTRGELAELNTLHRRAKLRVTRH